jgi:hypothetical protein
MDRFSDWRVQESEDEQVAHRFRSEEIQKLINLQQYVPLKNITLFNKKLRILNIV